MSAESVLGSSDHERGSLASLGLVLASVVRRVDHLAGLECWPVEVARWIWPKSAATLSVARKKVVEDLGAIALAAIQQDPTFLERVYVQIVSAERRRRLGTFFTPGRVVVDSLKLAESVLTETPACVVDPGAGAGAYSLEAARRWPNAQIVALDINVATLGALGINGLVAGIGPKQLILQCSDFLAFDIGLTLEPRLLLGNPPYTRHQELSAATKKRALKSSRGLVRTSQAGLSAHFLARCLNALQPNDSLVLLLPANLLQTNYARELRDHVWSLQRRRVEVHNYPRDLQIFPDARIAAMLLAVGPERPRKQHLHFVEIGRSSAVKIVRDGVDKRPDWGPSQRKAVPAVSSTDREGRATNSPKVRRGLATGANPYFLLTDKEAAKLPASAVQPIVPRLKSISSDRLTALVLNHAGKRGVPRWVLSIGDDDCEDHRVREYLQKGVTLSVPNGVLTKARKKWFDLRSELVTAPILIGPMTKQTFRILENPLGIFFTNSLFGITPEDPRTVDAWVKYLRSDVGQSELVAIARHLGSGLMKLEPRALVSLLSNAPVSARSR